MMLLVAVMLVCVSCDVYAQDTEKSKATESATEPVVTNLPATEPVVTDLPATEPVVTEPVISEKTQVLSYTPTEYAASLNDLFWGNLTEGSPLTVTCLVPESWKCTPVSAETDTYEWQIYFLGICHDDEGCDIGKDPQLGGGFRITSWYDTSRILTGETASALRYAYCQYDPAKAHTEGYGCYGATGAIDLGHNWYLQFELSAPWGQEAELFAIFNSIEVTFAE